jgi:hypothetical protein
VFAPARHRDGLRCERGLRISRGHSFAGSKSSIGFPEGSSSRICLPPRPVMIVAETNTQVAQRFNLANEIVDLQLNPVPPSGRWHPSVGHCLGRASSAARRINQESQVVARQDCESGSGIKTDLEVEMAGGSIRSINPC